MRATEFQLFILFFFLVHLQLELYVNKTEVHKSQYAIFFVVVYRDADKWHILVSIAFEKAKMRRNEFAAIKNENKEYILPYLVRFICPVLFSTHLHCMYWKLDSNTPASLESKLINKVNNWILFWAIVSFACLRFAEFCFVDVVVFLHVIYFFERFASLYL